MTDTMSTTANGATISNTERERLMRAGREQAKVAEAEIARVAAENKARFEADLQRQFIWTENAVWQRSKAEADAYVAPLIAKVEAECERAGIPRRYRPRLSVHWDTGGLKMSADETKVMRRLALARIDADAVAARAAVKRRLAEFNVAVLTDGLSETARAMLASMPSVADLLEPVTFAKARGFLLDEVARASTQPYYDIDSDTRELVRASKAEADAIDDAIDDFASEVMP